MKKILILLGLLLALSMPVHAKVWSTDEEGALCVSGEGNYRVWGYGDFYVSGAGMFRFDANAPVVIDGDWDTMTNGRYKYFSGAGTLVIEDYQGEIVSAGGGSGYIELHGIGWASLRGSAREMNIGCIWE